MILHNSLAFIGMREKVLGYKLFRMVMQGRDLLNVAASPTWTTAKAYMSYVENTISCMSYVENTFLDMSYVENTISCMTI